MPIFDYTAVDHTGREVTGRLEAADASDVAQILHGRGLLALRATPADAEAARAGSVQLRLKPHELALFARQLATLTQADLPVAQCLRLVAAQNRTTTVGAAADAVAEGVMRGQALSVAVRRVVPDAPPVLGALLEAGEARGAFAPGLTDAALIFEQAQDLRTRLVSAFVYPAVLLAVALLVIGIVLGVLVPALLPLFRDSGLTPPLVLRLGGAVTETVAAAGWIGMAVASAVLLGCVLLLRAPVIAQTVRAGLLRMPMFGPLLRANAVAILTRTLGTLLRNGVPLVDAVILTADVTGHPSYRAALLAAAERVREGGRLAVQFSDPRLFPVMVERFIAVGEEASRVDDMLLRLADAADADARQRTERTLALLAPAMTLGIGLIVGVIILSVIQAILAVNDVAFQ